MYYLASSGCLDDYCPSLVHRTCTARAFTSLLGSLGLDVYRALGLDFLLRSNPVVALSQSSERA